MRALLVVGLLIALTIAVPSATADPAPEPWPWCERLHSPDPVIDTALGTVHAAQREACHAHACVAYSYGKVALIRQCLGV